MKAPERFDASILRRPMRDDAEAVFAQYSSDAEITKYLGWPRHQSLEHTKLFLAFSDAEWDRWPGGRYLIESRSGEKLLGGTGLAFESPTVASTGYVLARDAWDSATRLRHSLLSFRSRRTLELAGCTPCAIKTIQPQSMYWRNVIFG